MDKVTRQNRVVRNQIGRVLFLQRKYPEAVAELERVLAVDPEDLQAHYTLMLAAQGAGDAERARTHVPYRHRIDPPVLRRAP